MPLRIQHLYVVLRADGHAKEQEALYSHGTRTNTGLVTLPVSPPSLLDLPGAFEAIQSQSRKLRETREDIEVYELCEGDDAFAYPVKVFLAALDVIIDEVLLTASRTLSATRC